MTLWVPTQGPDEPWQRFIYRAVRVFRGMAVETESPAARLRLLQAFAAVKVTQATRPVGVGSDRYRAFRSRPARGPNARCFVCRRTTTTRHHVMQLQHGGEDVKRNKVPLCDGCHADVHPWLRKPLEAVNG